MDGWPCVLCHGFPYDAQAYADVAPLLAAAGARVVVPYLRGYGPTRFRSPDTLRSGEQAALGADLLALLDALRIPRAVLGGYDWGGRAACIVAALWPERVMGLVSGSSYNIQNIARAMEPAAPLQEARFLVPVLSPFRTWPPWPRSESPRFQRTSLADLVADLDVRRRDVCPHGCLVRQSGLRRCRRTLLSPSIWHRARRSRRGGHRTTSRVSANDRRSDDHHRR